MPVPFPHPGERATLTVCRLRDEVGPVVAVELAGGVPAWLATSYDAVSEVLANEGVLYSKDARHFGALRDGTLPAGWPLRRAIEADHMLNKDGDEHRRLRGLVGRAFTQNRVQALAPRIEEIADGLLDRLAAIDGDSAAHGGGPAAGGDSAAHGGGPAAGGDPAARDGGPAAGGGGPVNLVAGYADPLPVVVICELFGVPERERDDIRRWATTLISLTSAPDEIGKAWQDLIAHLTAHIGRRRRDPRDDLTTALLQAQEQDGDRLGDDEILWILWLVILAGHETTVHLIANAVIALCADPAQLALAREKDAWAEVVEETLRSRSPMSAGLFRYATRDVELAGVRIPAGQPVLVGFGGTGTDPARFGAGAGRFDISRGQETHLGFGRGPHFCLGAPLARLEARIALSRLFGRFPGLRMAVPPEEIAYTPSWITEGPVALPVFTGR
ncbi:cytochrome P450 family protein [Nonomuraea sp. PA05]|uniref:cytochrome P450 family protein n=1 Tax=Nonomuraea sp. PA05 TaxID=2604466 RepID=UPI001651D2CA|nr:cytochrome P450 [Nonomuraea sp. PA05]